RGAHVDGGRRPAPDHGLDDAQRRCFEPRSRSDHDAWGGSAPPSGAGSSAPSSGFAAILMDRGSPMLVERAVARRTALERGFETLHLATHRESRPDWFLAHQGRQPLGGGAQARSVSRYGAGWPTAPALVARSPGIRTNSADQSPDAGT